MYGPKIRVEYDGLGITLVPARLEWAKHYAEMMSSLRVNMWTNGLYGFTEADEREWLEKTAKDPKGVSWAILPDGCDLPVGNTGLHGIDPITGPCTSGIIIFDPTWWGKGVASRAHLARTWFATGMLNRWMIHSTVRDQNEASRKALERIGYTVTGRIPRSAYRSGVYVDTLNLTWLNPSRVGLLYPTGLPEEYVAGVERAKVALEKAGRVVTVL